MNARELFSLSGAMLTSMLLTSAVAAERIVFVGDSITGQSRNHSEGFARQLDAAYAATIADAAERPTVVSLGGSGQTVESWKNVEVNSRTNPQTTLDISGVYVGENLDQHADRLVIMLGMNNALQPTTSATADSLATYRKNYRELATNLVKRATPAKLYLASVPPLTEDPAGPKNVLMQAINAEVKALAEELKTDATCQAAYPGMEVNFLPVWDNQTNLIAVGRARDPRFHITGDMIHPNGVGHIRLAQTFLDGFGHTDASAWLQTNRLQPKLDGVATGNTAGLSYVLKYTGDGSAATNYPFSLFVNWVVRPGETAPSGAAFALSLPKGWRQTASPDVAGLGTTFTLEGPAQFYDTSIVAMATPASGSVRTISVTVPAPWLVSTPVAVTWNNLNPGWQFPYANEEAQAVTAAIKNGGDPEAIAAAQPARIPAWNVHFPSPDYLGDDDAATLDFAALSAYPVFGTAYAVRYVYAKRAVTAKLKFSTSSNAGALHNTVWLNGEEVALVDKSGETNVTFNAGNNLLVWRASHTTWQWQEALAIEDVSDANVTLRFGTKPVEPDPYEPEVIAQGDGSSLYVFLSNGTFTASCAGTAHVLLVGGGGGGGGVGGDNSYTQGGGGGGGGGDVRIIKNVSVNAGDHAVVVGMGGAQNENGGDSSVFALTAIGGGAGSANGKAAGAGGSGGGGSGGATAGGAVAAGASGNVGGDGVKSGARGAGGGGGGANAAGEAATVESSGGKGGDGKEVGFGSITAVYGAGGNGGKGTAKGDGASGAAGTGAGGAGGSSQYHINLGAGGKGGSGIVIVRFWPSIVDPEEFPGIPEKYALSDGTIVYTFKETGIFHAPCAGTVKAFLVGGGGGGGGNKIEVLAGPGIQTSSEYGCRAGGGGGGGGVVTNDAIAVEQRDYVIGVGQGGAANANGGDTSAFGLIAYGGGAGGVGSTKNACGKVGGSAGGSGAGDSAYTVVAATEPGVYDEATQGSRGGRGWTAQGYTYFGGAGGGGGAGGAGGDGFTVSDDGATTNVCKGAAGLGVACPYLANGVLYGAGGQGGVSEYNRLNPSNNCGTAGLDGIGQGGGGCSSHVHCSAGHGGRGGSGVAMIFFTPEKGYYRDIAKTMSTGGKMKAIRSSGEKWMTHTFTNSGSFVVSEPVMAQVMLIGGGGGGGHFGGGGGGAGGVIITNVCLLPETYAVTVGEGGTCGSNGQSTVFAQYTAIGGGGGGNYQTTGHGQNAGRGGTGGSGGGGARPYGTNKDYEAGGSGTDGQGCGGGNGRVCVNDSGNIDNNCKRGGGGGGGAGAAGHDGLRPNTESGGSIGSDGCIYGAVLMDACGGDGIESDFSGTLRWYAGGGGGALHNSYRTTDAAQGGKGGGGEGGTSWDANKNGGDGEPNTGSGGGGGAANGNTQYCGGKGGSGLVIIRYKLPRKGFCIKLQ